MGCILKNHTYKLINPISIINKMPNTWCVSLSQIPAQTQTQEQSNYIAASTFTKLILPRPSLGTQPRGANLARIKQAMCSWCFLTQHL